MARARVCLHVIWGAICCEETHSVLSQHRRQQRPRSWRQKKITKKYIWEKKCYWRKKWKCWWCICPCVLRPSPSWPSTGTSPVLQLLPAITWLPATMSRLRYVWSKSLTSHDWTKSLFWGKKSRIRHASPNLRADPDSKLPKAKIKIWKKMQNKTNKFLPWFCNYGKSLGSNPTTDSN